jgi:hypothetical protein
MNEKPYTLTIFRKSERLIVNCAHSQNGVGGVLRRTYDGEKLLSEEFIPLKPDDLRPTYGPWPKPPTLYWEEIPGGFTISTDPPKA